MSGRQEALPPLWQSVVNDYKPLCPTTLGQGGGKVDFRKHLNSQAPPQTYYIRISKGGAQAE